MKVRDLMPSSWSSRVPLEPRPLYDYPATAQAIATTKVVPKTVTLWNRTTGEIVGKRTIYSK